MDHGQAQAIDLDRVPVGQEMIRLWRKLGDITQKASGALRRVARQQQIGWMEKEVCAGARLDVTDGEYVIDVCVRVRDQFDLDSHIPRECQDVVRLVAWIDADGFARSA